MGKVVIILDDRFTPDSTMESIAHDTVKQLVTDPDWRGQFSDKLQITIQESWQDREEEL